MTLNAGIARCRVLAARGNINAAPLGHPWGLPFGFFIRIVLQWKLSIIVRLYLQGVIDHFVAFIYIKLIEIVDHLARRDALRFGERWV